MSVILPSYNLAEVTDQYMIERFIKNRKYYAGYLAAAKNTWKELFRSTIYSVQSEWQPLRDGDPYPYIKVPNGMERLFSVSLVDQCGLIVPLEYNNYANIIPLPTINTCGCDACVCDSGICNDTSSLTKITKLLFTVSGIDYYESIWIKVCPNGDIIEYRSVPVKKYNDFTGDGGDYNNDYNNDYLIENPPFSDYTIVYQEFQRILCNIEVKKCGCPANTVSNREIFTQHCAPYCQPFSRCRTDRDLCKRVYENSNYNGCILGTIKMSECGTQIYYIPPPRGRNQTPAKLPEYLLVNYQTSGENCNSMVEVPEYALNAMFYGIDYRTKRFNNMFSGQDKQQAKYAYVESQNQLILYLSNLNLNTLAQVQDKVIRF